MLKNCSYQSKLRWKDKIYTYDQEKDSAIYKESNNTHCKMYSRIVSYRSSQFTILLLLHLICHSIHISNRYFTSIQSIYRFSMVKNSITRYLYMKICRYTEQLQLYVHTLIQSSMSSDDNQLSNRANNGQIHFKLIAHWNHTTIIMMAMMIITIIIYFRSHPLCTLFSFSFVHKIY